MDDAVIIHRYDPDERTSLIDISVSSATRVLVVGESHPELNVGGAEQTITVQGAPC